MSTRSHTDDLARTPEPIASSSPQPTRRIDFAPPRDGDWLILVLATFQTGDGSEAWSDTLFRLVVGDTTANPIAHDAA